MWMPLREGVDQVVFVEALSFGERRESSEDNGRFPLGF
jgi:hypothetical protein